MGSLVSFTPRRAVSKTLHQTAALAGTVIIFPGVRYERAPETDARSTDGLEGWVEPTVPAPPKH